MTSQQMSAGAGKAAKFVAANPLGPMADPFAGLDDDQKEYHKEMSENVNNRLEKAMEELKEKHAKGTNEIDDPDRAPTGHSYRDHQAQVERQRRANLAEKERLREEEAARLSAMKDEAKRMFRDDNKETGDNGANDEEESDDDEYDDLLDEDPELEAIRERRIREMREAQAKQAENIARGHGQYRTITQDEFLPECTGGSEYIAVHFFHNEFERCKILDHHLKIIAPLHTTCKFVRIDAEKTPFFVSKLCVKTLPSLIVFRDGKTIDRLTGFEGLATDPKEPDKWHTGRLQQWLAKTGAINYKVPTEEILDEMRRLGVQPKGAVWSEENIYDE